MIPYILCAAIAAGFWFLLKKRRWKMNAELSGGFDNYFGLDLHAPKLVRVLVLEELERCGYPQYDPVIKKTQKKRTIYTGIYILLNFLFLVGSYYKSATAYICLLLAMIYIYLYHRQDPVNVICTAVQKEPDRDISQIVRQMTEEVSHKRLKNVAIAAFALSLGLFVLISANERYSFEDVEGGYCVEAYYPGIFSREEVCIPETHKGVPVVAIGKNAFEEVSTMKRLEIPKTVVLIDSYAFKDCSGLEEVRLPDGLRVLNGESFKGCGSLRRIEIPEGVTEIRGNTFEDCKSLEKVVLHDGIVDIHAYAFRNCESLQRITLPSGITVIHAYTFENCASLEEIEIPEGVVRIGAHAFNNCSALRSVYIPDSLCEIRSSAFRDCDSLKTIALPENVEIDERAFKDSPTKLKKK